MKKYAKIILTVMTCLMMVMCCASVFALDVPGVGTAKIEGEAEKANVIVATVVSYITYLAWGFALGMLLYIGIKYVMASANEKADLKKGAINYVIGAILVAAAGTIVKMLAAIGTNVTG